MRFCFKQQKAASHWGRETFYYIDENYQFNQFFKISIQRWLTKIITYGQHEIGWSEKNYSFEKNSKINLRFVNTATVFSIYASLVQPWLHYNIVDCLT